MRDYFFPQTQQEYTLIYGHENDTTTLLTKTIKVLGLDTIEVSDYGRNKEFYRSLKFVIKETHISVIQAKRSINSKVFSSDIILALWAQNKPGKNKKIQLDIRTSDTCTSSSLYCYWEWLRHIQSNLKRGNIMWEGKSLNTITFSFIELLLYQPQIFSSISGLSKSVKSYVFAEGVGLIKITTTIKKSNFTNTLMLRN